MFDTIENRIVVLRQPARRAEAQIGPDSLKDHCLHPAEAWVLRRRASRPHPAPRRLPHVARAG